jgi:hypothetical protein
MALPRLLLRVIDPAQGYFDRHSVAPHRGGSTLHRRAAVFGPGVPGGSRAATAEERAARAEDGVRHRTDDEAALADAKRRWAPHLRRAADELLVQGATQVVLGDRTVDARVIMFRRGDHLLHTTTRGPNGGGESLSRISRDPRRSGADVLIEYLARAATKG